MNYSEIIKKIVTWDTILNTVFMNEVGVAEGEVESYQFNENVDKLLIHLPFLQKEELIVTLRYMAIFHNQDNAGNWDRVVGSAKRFARRLSMFVGLPNKTLTLAFCIENLPNAVAKNHFHSIEYRVKTLVDFGSLLYKLQEGEVEI